MKTKTTTTRQEEKENNNNKHTTRTQEQQHWFVLFLYCFIVIIGEVSQVIEIHLVQFFLCWFVFFVVGPV